MPLPPPPAVAFSMIGYPISFAIFFASSASDNTPSPPGTIGTPADSIVSLAVALSPIDLIIFELGPIN